MLTERPRLRILAGSLASPPRAFRALAPAVLANHRRRGARRRTTNHLPGHSPSRAGREPPGRFGIAGSGRHTRRDFPGGRGPRTRVIAFAPRGPWALGGRSRWLEVFAHPIVMSRSGNGLLSPMAGLGVHTERRTIGVSPTFHSRFLHDHRPVQPPVNVFGVELGRPQCDLGVLHVANMNRRRGAVST